MDFLIWIAVIFLVIAIVAWLVGARGAAAVSANIAKWAAIIAIVIFVILLIIWFVTGAGAAAA
ncbi:MAG: DUF1328 family protein [Phycisphaeraceae bacterium]